MNRVLNLTYASSLTELTELNSSFAAGVMRIAYAGENRNGSFISKETFEKCAHTMRNCPIVCRYDREADQLGGHDMEIVRDDDGGLRLVNLTQPVGCVPESAKYRWENVKEADGTEREYLVVDVLLWKRQEAYRKIERSGVTAQSMEITVRDGKDVDGVYHIDDFEFTAFALLGDCEPCFESAGLELFSTQDFKRQLTEMMRELQETYSMIDTPTGADDTNLTAEGGETVLNDEMNLSEDEVIEEERDDEAREETSSAHDEPEAESGSAPEEENGAQPEERAFALAGQVESELRRTLADAEKIREPWGDEPRYCLADFDPDAMMVYAWDNMDWLLYGFPYTQSGDAVTVDFAGKRRMKYTIVEFADGETQPSPFMDFAEKCEKSLKDSADIEAAYRTASEKYAAIDEELKALREYRAEAEKEKARAARGEVFARFTDLNGNEAFEALKADCEGLSVEALEEKCYALRGRMSVPETFALDNKTPRLKVENHFIDNEPYGGLFAKYGIEH